jgi:hypothetical protein
LPAKDRLQRFLLLRVGHVIHEEGSLEAGCLPGPDVVLERGRQYEVQIGESNIAEMFLADAVRQHGTANIVCRRLSEYARTGDVAAANVEPVAGFATGRR